jgi:hypothetical protein
MHKIYLWNIPLSLFKYTHKHLNLCPHNTFHATIMIIFTRIWATSDDNIIHTLQNQLK